MNKYVPLDAVLNYVPEVLKDDTDTVQLLSWANQAYRDFNLPSQTELKTVLIDVVSHKAKLPNDVKLIVDVLYSSVLWDGTTTALQNFGDYRVIVYQEIYFGSTYYLNSKPLKYKGQNRAPLIDDNLYCRTCEIGFTIDKTMSCLTIDLADGEVTLIYYAPVKDEQGNILIPDDPALMEGLSWHIQSRYWLNRSYTGDNTIAYRFHTDASTKAATMLSKFRGKELLKAIDSDKHNAFLMRRNRYSYQFSRNNRP